MFIAFESPYPYFCCDLRHNVMPYMYSEMQNKLSENRESPLESMGQIISSRCPEMVKLIPCDATLRRRAKQRRAKISSTPQSENMLRQSRKTYLSCLILFL